ncbi:MAG: hypothetical protein LQ340_006759 [Diploschistes diacapsis]|nr:MAG: hypothetical protein LQ340_006759 [Diploschistes diacapsis]
MALLKDLPLEIRQEIYPYLLVMEKVAYEEASTSEWRAAFCTSLFLVDKQISRESLNFFYVWNAFSIVRVHCLSDPMIHELHRAMLVKVVPDESIPRNHSNFPVDACLIYTAKGRCSKGTTLVVPAKEMNFFVRLLSQRHAVRWAGQDLAVEASLTLNLQGPLFGNRPIIQDNVKLPWNHLSTPNDRLAVNVYNVRTDGSLHIIGQMKTRPYSGRDTIVFCYQYLQLIKSLIDRGYYKDALRKVKGLEVLLRCKDSGAVANDPVLPYFLVILEMHMDLTKSICCARLKLLRFAVYAIWIAEEKSKTAAASLHAQSVHGQAPSYWDFCNGCELFPVDPFELPIKLITELLHKKESAEPSRFFSTSAMLYAVRHVSATIKELKKDFQRSYPDLVSDPHKFLNNRYRL